MFIKYAPYLQKKLMLWCLSCPLNLSQIASLEGADPQSFFNYNAKFALYIMQFLHQLFD